MRIFAWSLVAALAALALSSVPLTRAQAGACDHDHTKIHGNDATCLSASWTNYTGSWGQGSASWDMQSLCHEHGTVVAEIDVKNASDKTFTLTDGKIITGDLNKKTRGVFCCWDAGELCFKEELQPNRWNWLKFKSGNEYGSQKLDTAKKKCAFCERYSDNIWCENSFDDSICKTDGLICTNASCGADNCENAFAASSAQGTCTLSTGVSSEWGKCSLWATCSGRSGTQPTGMIPIEDIYALHNCKGKLTVGECPK